MKDQEADLLKSGSGDGGREMTLEDCGELSEAAMGELEILVGSSKGRSSPVTMQVVLRKGGLGSAGRWGQAQLPW
jgi:hypothetical protein